MVQLFDEVDSDHSGSISYKELIAAVEAHSSKIVSSNGDEADGGSKGVQAIGPAWLRGEIEKPAGVKDHGTWKGLVYTEEQQVRARCAAPPPRCAAPCEVCRASTHALLCKQTHAR